MHRRYISSCKLVLSSRRYSTNYLTAGLKFLKERETIKIEEKPTKHTTKEIKATFIDLINTHGIKPQELTDRFLQKGQQEINPKILPSSQGFWNNAKINLDYTVAEVESIPDVKYKQLNEERAAKLEASLDLDPANVNTKKTFGIQPHLLKPLPEILFIGHTNAGKSTVINRILSPNSAQDDTHAYVSKRAGFTKTLNCFNISKKLRLIDSPGYGHFGEEKQGKLVLNYLSTRQVLRRVFIIVDGTEGFRDVDLDIINHLTTIGVPFEIIITKLDMIVNKIMGNTVKNKKFTDMNTELMAEEIAQANKKIIEYYEKMLRDNGILDSPASPRILVVNSATNKYITSRHGFKEIRYYILQSCGIIE